MTASDLSTGDDALLRALLRGATHAQAALACGLSERTVRRRVAGPEFRGALVAARRETLMHTADALATAGLSAVRGLTDLMTDPQSPAAVRRSAARDLLDLSMRVREQVVLEQRIADLEQSLLQAQ
jgi:hypothetical protein